MLIWEDGIRVDLRDIGWRGAGVDSTGSGRTPLAGSCEHSDEPSSSGASYLVIVHINVTLDLLPSQIYPVYILNFNLIYIRI
jgi:hypothetical protein